MTRRGEDRFRRRRRQLTAALGTDAGWKQAGREHTFVVYTRADEVAAITRLDDLVKLLAPIDTAGDALMVVEAHALTADCAKNNVRPTTGGFEVFALPGAYEGKGPCGGDDYDEQVVSVDAAGSLRVVQTAHRPGHQACE